MSRRTRRSSRKKFGARRTSKARRIPHYGSGRGGIRL